MRRFVRILAYACASVILWLPANAQAQARPTALAAIRADAAALRVLDLQIDQMTRSGDLRVRETIRDTMVPDRVHERLDQYVRGVRIAGGDLTRQTTADGTVSIFGMMHVGVDLEVVPRLTMDDARAAVTAGSGGEYRGPDPELIVLPLSDGYHLAYIGQAHTQTDIVNVIVDANSGSILKQYSDFINEVGVGTGTYGDTKKISVKSIGGTFVADDGLRPSDITTYDMKGSLGRAVSILNGLTPATADIASSASNQWTDGAVVDGHVYAGWYYDFLQKRFGRRGLDDRDLRIPVLTHPVPLSAIFSAPLSVVGQYYLNAFWCPTCMSDRRGAITFGEGAPSTYLGVLVYPYSSALDVVAHELTHGVTSNTARLNSFPFADAPALNEAFSDMFGTATEFFYQPVGTGPMKADYLMGEDLAVPFGSRVIRSLNDPQSLRGADHYSQRDPAGEPHQQSTIASHAFYLAIEGGTNRTSRQTVTGVGAANRDQIEKVFFRALTVLLPSGATYALVRDTTIQAARDLYGAGGAVERAVTQAWDAVGVQDRIAPVATMLPNPATSDPTCNVPGLTPPTWAVGATVSAGSSNLRVTAWTWDFFDHTGQIQDHEVFSAANFAQYFTACGPGSSTLLAQTDSCTALCVDLRGDSNGTTQMTFTATTDAGQTLTFSTPRVVLRK